MTWKQKMDVLAPMFGLYSRETIHGTTYLNLDVIKSEDTFFISSKDEITFIHRSGGHLIDTNGALMSRLNSVGKITED